ncbi:MAG: hypothetical protein LBU32_24705 [Clostridiales bacterium]|jgi:hypothetical protein|nr:hypothetical protein [Clostridiales bacterium]
MACGYIAKNTRIRNGLEKDHAADARCAGGNPLVAPLEAIYMHGYQLFDRVQMPGGQKGFIFGRRLSGSFDVRTLDGEKLSAGISHKKLKPLTGRASIPAEKRKGREAHSSPA